MKLETRKWGWRDKLGFCVRLVIFVVTAWLVVPFFWSGLTTAWRMSREPKELEQLYLLVDSLDDKYEQLIEDVSSGPYYDSVLASPSLWMRQLDKVAGVLNEDNAPEFFAARSRYRNTVQRIVLQVEKSEEAQALKKNDISEFGTKENWAYSGSIQFVLEARQRDHASAAKDMLAEIPRRRYESTYDAWQMTSRLQKLNARPGEDHVVVRPFFEALGIQYGHHFFMGLYDVGKFLLMFWLITVVLRVVDSLTLQADVVEKFQIYFIWMLLAVYVNTPRQILLPILRRVDRWLLGPESSKKTEVDPAAQGTLTQEVDYPVVHLLLLNR